MKFDAFAVRLTTLPNNEIRFHIADGPYARTETVKFVATLIRPGVFVVSWVEASGATVVHVEDFAQSIPYSHATLPDGTFLRIFTGFDGYGCAWTESENAASKRNR